MSIDCSLSHIFYTLKHLYTYIVIILIIIMNITLIADIYGGFSKKKITLCVGILGFIGLINKIYTKCLTFSVNFIFLVG